jgi:hypothetical protein
MNAGKPRPSPVRAAERLKNVAGFAKKKLFLKEEIVQNITERKDVYSRITAQIVEHLEKGVRPWNRPWNAEHAAGPDYAPLTPQWPALLRNQCPVALDVGPN